MFEAGRIWWTDSIHSEGCTEIHSSIWMATWRSEWGLLGRGNLELLPVYFVRLHPLCTLFRHCVLLVVLALTRASACVAEILVHSK